MKEEEVQCPFCKDFGFDLKGLKMHINNNWCPEWDKVDDDELDAEEEETAHR